MQNADNIYVSINHIIRIDLRELERKTIAMEITDKSSSAGISGYTQTVRDNKLDKAHPDDARAAETGGDKVRLSNGAREVQEAIRILKQLPDIRFDKVAELKAKVEQGIYRPESRKIVFNLIKHSLLNEIH